METMQGMKRTHGCGTLRKEQVGAEVTLCGWVSRRRDHGGLIFVDMRDRSGFVQIVFDEAAMAEGTFHEAETLRSEFVICVRGTVRARSAETVNPNMETGEVEVVVNELRCGGVRALMDYAGRSMKAQMKQANRSGARYAIILGEDELAAHTALVRDMAESAQETCALDHLVEKMISEVKV